MPDEIDKANEGQQAAGEFELAVRKSRVPFWLASISLMIALLTWALFPCACGYLFVAALPFSAAAAALAWCGWLTSKASLPGRLLHIIVVVVTTLLLGKTLLDVLWLGHNALLRNWLGFPPH